MGRSRRTMESNESDAVVSTSGAYNHFEPPLSLMSFFFQTRVEVFD